MRVAALILAILAGVLGVPAAACSGVCVGMAAVAMEEDPSVEYTEEDDEAMGIAAGMFMCSGLIGAMLYILGGVLALFRGPWGGVVCAVATALTALTLLSFSPLSLVVFLLGLVATILAFLRRHPAPKGA